MLLLRLHALTSSLEVKVTNRAGPPFHLASKGPSSQSCGFSSSHVQMWELDYQEGWAWCLQTVVLEKTLERPLNCMEVKSVHPKGNQTWIFNGRTGAEAEALILWLPDEKSWLIGKRPWCWENVRAGEEEGDRGWDGWMASLTQWTGVWANSRRWWRTREAWRAAVHGVAKSLRTWLSNWAMTATFDRLCRKFLQTVSPRKLASAQAMSNPQSSLRSSPPCPFHRWGNWGWEVMPLGHSFTTSIIGMFLVKAVPASLYVGLYTLWNPQSILLTYTRATFLSPLYWWRNWGP